MIVFKNNERIESKSITMKDDGDYLYVIDIIEMSLLHRYPEIKTKIVDNYDPDDCCVKYEFHDNHDMLYMNIPEELRDDNSFSFLWVYIAKNFVLCVYEDWPNLPFIADLICTNMAKGMSSKKTVISLIDAITKDDFKVLGAFEDMIAVVEDSVTDDENETEMDKIAEIRRKVRPRKRFYESLIDTLEDISENENEIYSDSDLKYASRIYGRVDRLYRTVLNLRDYISQVREAFQAEIDIGLNRIMKAFTVITAVFLPLSLVAGWYGMNFEYMPEFKWKYGYHYVIGLSVVIAVGCLAFFKKKKWF